MNSCNDLCQIVLAIRWNDYVLFSRQNICLEHWVHLPVFRLFRLKRVRQLEEQFIYAAIIELRSLSQEHRNLRFLIKDFARAFVLLGYVTKGIHRASTVRFIDRNQVCEIDHVDFLKL
ncbi:hypothetical protein D3C87_1785050 [compost metagenome]